MTKKLHPAIVVHGGAGASSDHWDGCEHAARHGLEKLLHDASAIDAAVAAASEMEDDVRFNAGTGSNLRLDGLTIEMDAGVMDSLGNYGAVAAIRNVKNPVRVAARVLQTPHHLLVGEGALRFARAQGFSDHNPVTPRALERHQRLLEQLKAGSLKDIREAWQSYRLASGWNFARNLEEVLGPSDTIGAITRDRQGQFAVATSTGGTSLMLLGRVGDTPLIGAGLFAGPAGAVAATGVGEELMRRLVCRVAYEFMERGFHPEEACERIVSDIPDHIPAGLIAINADSEGVACNRNMPFVILPAPI